MSAIVRMVGFGVLLCGVAALMGSCSRPAAPSGSYQIDTARFVLSSPNPNPGNSGTAPGISIDTNTAVSGLSGGTVKSHKPYDIAFDYTDNGGGFARLTFTGIEVVYDDGAREGSVDGLAMPWSVEARDYETVNSMSGGQVVRSTVSLLSGQIEGVIARDESFALRMEGYFTRKDGGVEAFVIDERWVVEVERGTKPAGEVLQDR